MQVHQASPFFFTKYEGITSLLSCLTALLEWIFDSLLGLLFDVVFVPLGLPSLSPIVCVLLFSWPNVLGMSIGMLLYMVFPYLLLWPSVLGLSISYLKLNLTALMLFPID